MQRIVQFVDVLQFRHRVVVRPENAEDLKFFLDSLNDMGCQLESIEATQ